MEEEEEVERRTDGRTDAEVHANSTFDEMRAREIKVERAPSTTCVGRISGSAGPNGRAADRPTETDGRTDAFATHFSTFPGIGVSGRGRAAAASRAGRAHSCISSTLFREVSPYLRLYCSRAEDVREFPPLIEAGSLGNRPCSTA